MSIVSRTAQSIASNAGPSVSRAQYVMDYDSDAELSEIREFKSEVEGMSVRDQIVSKSNRDIEQIDKELTFDAEINHVVGIVVSLKVDRSSSQAHLKEAKDDADEASDDEEEDNV